MPDAPEIEAEVAEIVRTIEAGEDRIEVPEELVVEPERAAPARPMGTLQAQIIAMGMSEKLKLALRGNKDARMILIHDGNKIIRRFVLSNVRITDGEVIAVARNRNVDEEMLRLITERREWMRNYQVRLAIATNPKAPLPVALRQVSSLDQRDLRQIAKSKNVPQAIAAHARRLLLLAHGDKE